MMSNLILSALMMMNDVPNVVWYSSPSTGTTRDPIIRHVVRPKPPIEKFSRKSKLEMFYVLDSLQHNGFNDDE